MTKKIFNSFGFAWMLVLFIVPLPFLYTLHQGLTGIHANQNFSILLGSLAYVWMLVAIYIATKPKWLDRWIGLPHSYMIHGMLSLLAIVMALIHKELNPSSGLIKNTGDVGFAIFLGIAIYSMVFMAGWLTSRVPKIKQFKDTLEAKFFKHEISVWLHRLNIIATLLIFLHINLIDYISSIKPFMFLIWLSTLFVMFSYIWFHFKPNANGVKATLVQNVTLSPNVQELTVRLPRRPRQQFRPGDFAFLSFPQVKGMGEPHPFSIANAPKREDYLTFAIRGDGDFTRQLATVPNNSDILVAGGYGRYQTVIKRFKPKHLIIIGGGIGVVPLLSVVEGNPNIATQFYYTVKNESQFIYTDKLQEWEHTRQNFKALYQVGRYTDDVILSQLPENPKDYVVLLGGPIPMGRHWKKVMEEHGIEPDRVYFEEFSW